MTHDPYRLCADVTCPHCGVKGRIVSEQETRYFDDEGDDFDLLTCVECGGLHESHGSSGDEHLKLMRVQFGRLIEGRPYEAAKPVAQPSSDRKPLDLSAFEAVLKDYYPQSKADELWDSINAHTYSVSNVVACKAVPSSSLEMRWHDYGCGIVSGKACSCSIVTK